MPKSCPDKIYEFEDFRLDVAHLLLYKNAREIPFAPKVIETLLALVEHCGEVIRKDELMEIIWKDSIVEEGNLFQNLHLLRKVLGKTADDKPFIETLHKRGYRFNGDVSCVEAKPNQYSSTNENQSDAPKHFNVERQGNVLALADWKTNERNETGNGDYQSQISEFTENNAGEFQTSKNQFSIVGRKKEISQIKNLLSQSDVRLVTLAGVGGAGKTRLAQAVAQEISQNFSNGVFFVELAAISNPELVVSIIAQQFGIKEAGDKPILENLKDYLSDKQMLLTLDNFEQVIDAAPNIVKLLAVADKLKILITSRALLHLSAEREFVVPPLNMPDETSNISLDELSNYEAVELFVNRARNAKPGFNLTNENAGEVAEICARLDGLPLAIELAAARVKILSPRLILAKLENRLKLLTGGASDLPARQKTMRDAIEWSYDLLTEEEKLLFRRLSVFAGGFTFEAAEAVCGNDKLRITNYESSEDKKSKTKDQIEVLDIITSLVDKNLLVLKEQANDEQRFRMLETVREYALESLEKNNEAEAVRGIHAEYFLALGEEAEPFLQAAQSAEWINRLEEEHDNLRLALLWALPSNTKLGQRLVGAIWRFWWLHGHIREACEMLAAFLSQTDTTDKKARTKMLLGAGFLNRLSGNLNLSRLYAAEGLVFARETSDPKSSAFASYILGMLALDDDDLKDAERSFEKGLLFAKDSDDKQILGLLLNGLGEFARMREDYERAADFYGQALIINREIGDAARQATNLINLGATALSQKDLEAAGIFYLDGLKISSKMADMNGTLYCLEGVAGAYWAVRKPERAALLFGAAEASRQLNNLLVESQDRLLYDQSIRLVRDSLTEKEFDECRAEGHKLKLDEAVALCNSLDERFEKLHSIDSIVNAEVRGRKDKGERIKAKG